LENTPNATNDPKMAAAGIIKLPSIDPVFSAKGELTDISFFFRRKEKNHSYIK
jgi:hypothetical protein